MRQSAPLLKYGGGGTNVFTRGVLAYAHLLIHHQARPVGAQPTIQDSLRQTQSFDCPGYQPHIEDIKFSAPPIHDGIKPSTRLKEVFRTFHTLRSMVRFQACNASSSQDDAYFSEHPAPFFRRNTSNLLAYDSLDCVDNYYLTRVKRVQTFQQSQYTPLQRI